MNSVEAIIHNFKNEYHHDPDNLSLFARAPSDEPIRLRPLQARREFIGAEDLNRLVRWRNANRSAFLTDTPTTPERTLRWLTESHGPDLSRILFMIESANGCVFGHLGLCSINEEESYCELDNVIRGDGGQKGAMSIASRVLLQWAGERLELQHIWVRVLADNPAVLFYSRLGFQTVRDVPLVRSCRTNCGISWIEAPDRLSLPSEAETYGSPSRGQRLLRYMKLRDQDNRLCNNGLSDSLHAPK